MTDSDIGTKMISAVHLYVDIALGEKICHDGHQYAALESIWRMMFGMPGPKPDELLDKRLKELEGRISCTDVFLTDVVELNDLDQP